MSSNTRKRSASKMSNDEINIQSQKPERLTAQHPSTSVAQLQSFLNNLRVQITNKKQQIQAFPIPRDPAGRAARGYSASKDSSGCLASSNIQVPTHWPPKFCQLPTHIRMWVECKALYMNYVMGTNLLKQLAMQNRIQEYREEFKARNLDPNVDQHYRQLIEVKTPCHCLKLEAKLRHCICSSAYDFALSFDVLCRLYARRTKNSITDEKMDGLLRSCMYGENLMKIHELPSGYRPAPEQLLFPKPTAAPGGLLTTNRNPNTLAISDPPSVEPVPSTAVKKVAASNPNPRRFENLTTGGECEKRGVSLQQQNLSIVVPNTQKPVNGGPYAQGASTAATDPGPPKPSTQASTSQVPLHSSTNSQSVARSANNAKPSNESPNNASTVSLGKLVLPTGGSVELEQRPSKRQKIYLPNQSKNNSLANEPSAPAITEKNNARTLPVRRPDDQHDPPSKRRKRNPPANDNQCSITISTTRAASPVPDISNTSSQSSEVDFTKPAVYTSMFNTTRPRLTGAMSKKDRHIIVNHTKPFLYARADGIKSTDPPVDKDGHPNPWHPNFNLKNSYDDSLMKWAEANSGTWASERIKKRKAGPAPNSGYQLFMTAAVKTETLEVRIMTPENRTQFINDFLNHPAAVIKKPYTKFSKKVRQNMVDNVFPLLEQYKFCPAMQPNGKMWMFHVPCERLVLMRSTPKEATAQLNRHVACAKLCSFRVKQVQERNRKQELMEAIKTGKKRGGDVLQRPVTKYRKTDNLGSGPPRAIEIIGNDHAETSDEDGSVVSVEDDSSNGDHESDSQMDIDSEEDSEYGDDDDSEHSSTGDNEAEKDHETPSDDEDNNDVLAKVYREPVKLTTHPYYRSHTLCPLFDGDGNELEDGPQLAEPVEPSSSDDSHNDSDSDSDGYYNPSDEYDARQWVKALPEDLRSQGYERSDSGCEKSDDHQFLGGKRPTCGQKGPSLFSSGEWGETIAKELMELDPDTDEESGYESDYDYDLESCTRGDYVAS